MQNRLAQAHNRRMQKQNPNNIAAAALVNRRGRGKGFYFQNRVKNFCHGRFARKGFFENLVRARRQFCFFHRPRRFLALQRIFIPRRVLALQRIFVASRPRRYSVPRHRDDVHLLVDKPHVGQRNFMQVADCENRISPVVPRRHFVNARKGSGHYLRPPRQIVFKDGRRVARD